jgi:Transmembrane domain of unknown function (DUF3566)
MTQSRWSGPPAAGPNFAASRADAPPRPAASDAPTTTIPTGTAASAAAASRPGEVRSARPSKQVRGPRRARLQLRHINPMTVLKFSCVLAVALFFVWLIVIGVLYGILDGAGVLQKINDTVTTINGPGSKPPITAGIVFGAAAVIGAVNIVLFIALATIGSVIYNLCADLVGGIEITLSER